jgi:hypothetical protein
VLLPKRGGEAILARCNGARVVRVSLTAASVEGVAVRLYDNDIVAVAFDQIGVGDIPLAERRQVDEAVHDELLGPIKGQLASQDDGSGKMRPEGPEECVIERGLACGPAVIK